MTTTEFDKKDLAAIKRAFRTSKATPEEVRVLLRPIPGFGQRMFQKVAIACALAPSFERYHAIKLAEPVVQDVLYPAWWMAFLVFVVGYIFVYWVVPRLGLPSFEVTIRPGAKKVTLSRFGYNTEMDASVCRFEASKSECRFIGDSIWSTFPVRRHFWQLLFSLASPCDALNEAFTEARIARRSGEEEERVPDETHASVGNQAIIGEHVNTFVENDEVAFLLPIPNWHHYFGVYISWGASAVAMVWHLKYFPNIEWDADVISSHLHASPLWLPWIPLLLYVAVVESLADPWMRRALAVIPKGQGNIVIRIGKRIRGVFPILDSSFSIKADAADMYEPHFFLEIETPLWSGGKPAGRSQEEVANLIQALRTYAGVPEPPRIDLHG